MAGFAKVGDTVNYTDFSGTVSQVTITSVYQDGPDGPIVNLSNGATQVPHKYPPQGVNVWEELIPFETAESNV